MTSTIAIEELRVGMHIQLDGGWLSHPFPLSAFRIASADQIDTLRGLGLARVRWVPEKSDPAPAAASGMAPVGQVASTPAAASANEPVAASTPAQDVPQDAAAQAVAQQAAARRQWVSAQREAIQRCERQHGEAALAWREASACAASNPRQAGRQTAALTQAMLDKMLVHGDVNIRLMSGGADRMAAHALNVAVVSMLIGRSIGLSAAELLPLGVGALLHDIGKQEVADRFRHADDSFNSSETNAYRDHVAKGVLMGQRMGLAPDALLVIAQHHEHTDGSGFPQRLTADRLAMAARIVAIVNRYDNLCNPASRAMALTPHEAVAMLFAQGRSRYDAAVLNAFIRMMGVYPAGSLVQLTDDRYGMVVGVNSNRPLKPCVLVHDSAISRGEAQLLDLEQVPDLCIRRSLASSKLPPATLQVLDPRPRVAYYFEAAGRAQPQQQELAA